MRSAFLYILLFVLCLQNAHSQSHRLNLYFETDSFRLTEAHKLQIDSLFAGLAVNDSTNVTITGFTDFVGNTAYNKLLSMKRAESARSIILSFLSETSVDPVPIGFGEFDSIPSAPVHIGVRQHRMVVLEVNNAVFKAQDKTDNPGMDKGFVNSDTSIKIVTTPRLVGLESLNSDSLQIGTAIILDDLNFHAGRHVLLRESIPRLKELLKTLQKYPNLHIRIEGHICCGVEGEPDGYDQDTGEQRLSYNRAHNIYQYLVRNGIAKTRLSFAGFGYSRPLYYPEKNDEEQKRNRRVEIIITKL